MVVHNLIKPPNAPINNVPVMLLQIYVPIMLLLTNLIQVKIL